MNEYVFEEEHPAKQLLESRTSPPHLAWEQPLWGVTFPDALPLFFPNQISTACVGQLSLLAKVQKKLKTAIVCTQT